MATSARDVATAVEFKCVNGRLIRMPWRSISYIQSIGLIIRAVGTGHDFLERLCSGQPCFKIVFSSSYSPHIARADVDNLIMQSERIPQVNAILQQFLVQFP